MKDNEKVTAIYGKYGKHFPPQAKGFHNLLWQVLVNKAFEGKTIAFTPVNDDGGFSIGIATANEQGYTSTGCLFKSGYEHNKCLDILDAVNLEVFGWNQDEAYQIIGSTMNKKEKENNDRFEIEMTGQDTWYGVTDKETEKDYTVQVNYTAVNDYTETSVFDPDTDNEVPEDIKEKIVQALP